MKILRYVIQIMPYIILAKTVVLSGNAVSKAKNVGYFAGGYKIKDLITKVKIRRLNKKRDWLNTLAFRKFSEKQFSKDIENVGTTFTDAFSKLDNTENVLSALFDSKIRDLNLI